eukprot:scaffold51376_cov62-Phaeocystis_antarctica.AAC.3
MRNMVVTFLAISPSQSSRVSSRNGLITWSGLRVRIRGRAEARVRRAVVCRPDAWLDHHPACDVEERRAWAVRRLGRLHGTGHRSLVRQVGRDGDGGAATRADLRDHVGGALAIHIDDGHLV